VTLGPYRKSVGDPAAGVWVSCWTLIRAYSSGWGHPRSRRAGLFNYPANPAHRA